jgi:hypothetical protein
VDLEFPLYEAVQERYKKKRQNGEMQITEGAG